MAALIPNRRRIRLSGHHEKQRDRYEPHFTRRHGQRCSHHRTVGPHSLLSYACIIGDVNSHGGTCGGRQQQRNSCDVGGQMNILIRAGAKARSKVLGKLRAHGRPIAWAPEWMRLGNLLTLGRWAYTTPGALVLLHPKRREPLESLFPALRRRYFIEVRSVRFLDQRLTPWRSAGPVDLSMAALKPYIFDTLLPDSPLLTRPTQHSDEEVVVNVRRGDYYSVDKHRAEYGMDIHKYVDAALSLLRQQSQESNMPIRVISDDPAWCRMHLDALLSSYGRVSYPATSNAIEDMRGIVHARRLILPNSTFSYWGGFIGDHLNPERTVIAPWLFSRAMDNGNSRYQVSPHWKIIDFPEGWPIPEK